MEPLEQGVANSCKSVSNYRKWNIGLQTVANQFLNMEPLEHGLQTVANQFLNMELLEREFQTVYKQGTIGPGGCHPKRFKIWLQTVFK